ncbi:hypothetical protein AQJ23_03560 [Streptomyces antibioticus]|nr:RICIN domain-containing protein [Streptomyces antibioticus]KUN29830.1 hypothetical protein AQJ23_03560 [Streptomyces antibioticus]
MNRLCDSAGIYHLSNDPGTVINGNYIHDVSRMPPACGSAVAGIYTDEGSDNMTLSNNVLSRTDGFINQNRNGSHVTLTNNTSSGDSVIKASGLESAYQGLVAKLNLAYNKPTSTSSVYGSGTSAANANDNNGSTGWSPTGSDSSAWWQVDLGQAYQLGQFSLTTRQDVDQSEIADFGVQQAGGALEDATGTPNTNPSTYYTIKNVNSGQLMDVYQASSADGGSVVQWPSNSGTNQQWSFVPVSGQLYRIVNRNSGKVLDIGGSSHWRGTALAQYTYNGGSNQLWYFEQVSGGYVIRNFESNRSWRLMAGRRPTEPPSVSTCT